MAFTQQLTYEALRSVDSSTLSGAYVALGGPLLFPASIVKLVNNSTSLVTVSINGTSDVDVAPAGSFWLYDNTTNSPTTNSPIFAPEGRQYYIKGSAGTGLVYLVVQYIVEPQRGV